MWGLEKPSYSWPCHCSLQGNEDSVWGLLQKGQLRNCNLNLKHKGKYLNSGISQTKRSPFVFPPVFHRWSKSSSRANGEEEARALILQNSLGPLSTLARATAGPACSCHLMGLWPSAPWSQAGLGRELPAPHLIPMGPRGLQKSCRVCNKDKWFYQEGSWVQALYRWD